ncbi:MAG: transcriptional repressor [Candidatus Aenigmarchaeota archaeon CG_4_9_14_3_um_filter_37_18]|nr:MAG: hypothetical protein AUK23_08190 [Deltaproteobacteria bacterium CG2_30_43_15]PIV68319.1 MAG: transcriptional repressor [Candidatus Aenigmarchaeota archaeon CG01_land_8_20_14_3_00_37_9]PIW41802.1 MAG: transcriptional repressor [Candidatus Aenigmarchaeota archaeon CG15_BIG_FIL_POST_REV_8_21_14_020_37_27]PIX50432.1 MAG: transcriptional repressor [Candidatus Aenigmarchaeota archaeon CG_4_8_14_3_um_filter_37_24]PJB75964.1 MAG: transcriptional repressor [Candidatus Aenigmarchaeota archaeon CG
MKNRMTNQRIKILDYLRTTKKHPSAEMVFSEVKKQLPAITLATVYRNLNLLAEKGDILRLEVNGEYRFDADTKLHQHCVCKKCGKVMDLFENRIKIPLNKIKIKDFEPESASVEIFGICKKCKGGKNVKAA